MTIELTPQPTRPWSDLDRVPSGPRARIAAGVARRLFATAVGRLDVTVLGASRGPLGRGGPVMRIHRPDEFFARVGDVGLIGFGEAYLSGAWEAEDLGGFLAVLAADLPRLVPAPLQRLRAAIVARPPRHHLNSVDNTRSNIGHHYDLSNDLFALFLDETLSYSAALYDTALVSTPAPEVRVATPPDSHDAEPLAAAQARKIERLLDQCGVREGTRLLEIGTGWGELAIRAARRGAVVRSVTLSSEQQALARERIAVAGLADRIDVDLCDYREVAGSFDAICSVEMIEAVGHEYWTEYFATLDRLLAPGGRVGLQAITMPHDRMLATKHTWTWINKYIFPGGFLPSVEAIEQITHDHTDLRVSDRLSFGSHYAATLRQWDETFLAAVDDVRALGFDDTFVRMWHFYLDYSRAGFTSGYLDVQQLTLERPS